MVWAIWKGISCGVALLIGAALFIAPAAAQTAPGDAAQVTRLVLRVTSSPTDPMVRGNIAAVDNRGQPVADLAARGLQATLDGQPIDLPVAADRPSLAVGVGLLLDSSANVTVRTALGTAIANGLQDIDPRRDVVAILSTAERRPWDQGAFTKSPDDLNRTLQTLVQSAPQDDMVSLDQVAGLQRLLAAQSQELKVLLLVTNRTPASAASPATSIAALRGLAVDEKLQVGMLVLPQAGPPGVAETLTEATPGGGVEYVLNATNQADLTQRVSSLLAPATGARRFSLAAPGEGTHTLSVTAAGLTTRAQATFAVSGRTISIAAIEANGAPLRPGSQLDRPVWVTIRLATDTPLEGVEWGVDGRLTRASADPFALLLDPDQISDGGHEITARAIAQGRTSQLATTMVYVPFDVARLVRRLVRDWGLIAAVVLANGLIALLLVRTVFRRRGDAGSGRARNEFPPVLRLKQPPGGFLAPEVIEFPARGKLRIGYHPPYMDLNVGVPEFSRLEFQDIRGDETLISDLSRHAACIWRDPETNDCFVQLGWLSPGEPIRPKPQSQVLHFGKPQDATNKAFRLSHQDIIRLSDKVEYIFNQLGLRDRATPERLKFDAFASEQGRAEGARVG